MNSNVRSALVGGLAATFVVAAAFAPKLMSNDRPSDVRFHQTSAEEVLETTTTLAEETTFTTEAPTTTTTVAHVLASTTTTMASTTTTTMATTTTTMALVWPANLPTDTQITGLAISDVMPMSATLTWNVLPDTYRFIVRSWDGEAWRLMGTTTNDAPTVTFPSLHPDTDYDIAVFPLAANGVEGAGAQVVFHTP